MVTHKHTSDGGTQMYKSIDPITQKWKSAKYLFCTFSFIVCSCYSILESKFMVNTIIKTIWKARRLWTKKYCHHHHHHCHYELHWELWHVRVYMNGWWYGLVWFALLSHQFGKMYAFGAFIKLDITVSCFFLLFLLGRWEMASSVWEVEVLSISLSVQTFIACELYLLYCEEFMAIGCWWFKKSAQKKTLIDKSDWCFWRVATIATAAYSRYFIHCPIPHWPATHRDLSQADKWNNVLHREVCKAEVEWKL